jgi:hypothetical protein
MFWLLLLLAVVLAVLEVLASRRNRAVRSSGQAGPRWNAAHRWRWAFGVPLAVASVFVSYPAAGATETYWVTGFPFMAAAFDQAGRDYVGPFTPFAFAANAAIWFFFPSLFLWGWTWFVRRSSPGEISN